ncbi:MAG: hypothetical protein ABMA64_12005 [Myxococcota bacterium]
MQLDPADPRLPSRPLWGLLLLSLPVVGVVFTAAAYGAMWAMGLRGRAADGPEVWWAVDGCPEAAAVVDARVRDVGLEPIGAPTPGQLHLRLPADPAVAAALPVTLTRPGKLEIRGGGEPLAGPEDVTSASPRMDLMMVPVVLVTVTPAAADRVTAWVRAHPGGRLDFLVDGEPVGWQSSQNPLPKGEYEIAPALADGPERWAAVAAVSVVADHPLPCPVTLTAVEGRAAAQTGS